MDASVREPGAQGLLLVDKPSGIASFAVVSEVRRRLDVRQVGHTGTLDPLASGLLPVLVGEATKLTPYLMDLDKVYEATVRLGAATDTYDSEGRVVSEGDFSSVTLASLTAALGAFVGRIRQRPPAYSAIKRNGKRLYELARAGESDLAIEPREVVVHEIDLLGFAPPDLRLRVRCGKGTYIRSIAHDLGEALGAGAHLTALRRTRIGAFSVDDAADVFAAVEVATALLPIERAVSHLPSVTVSAEQERRLRMGQQAALELLDVPLHAMGPVRLSDGEGRLVAIAEAPAGGALGRLSLSRVFQKSA